MKNKLYIGFTIILLAIISVLVFRPESKKDEDKLKQLKDQAETKKSFVKVKTTDLGKAPLVMYINTTGSAKAEKTVDIYPQISGFVKKISVEENSFVKKGDILFTIDNEQYDLNFQREQDNLLKAKIEYGMRKNQLKETDQSGNQAKLNEEIKKIDAKKKNGLITDEQYENLKLDLEIEYIFNKGGSAEVLKSSTGLTQALISYKKAKLDLEYSVVKANIDGYVADLKIVEGQYVTSGVKCMNLVSYNNIIMEIPVLESEVAELQEGRNVEVKFEAMKDTIFTGIIKSISPVIDKATGTGMAQVRIQNKDLLIKSGMSGNVKIEGRIYNDKVIVPNEAILTRDNRKLVFIAKENKAKWVYVTTGLSNYNITEIILEKEDPKLKLGDKVIISNNYTLAHDADIIIVDN
ncbi:MAG: efflux RND transporter periplasmic adaptor subunit [Candidatus Delongbacteria bacterium]|nr:efflux RND transporter periplasmic adaptor subunit [Candidatus Delongbacteria bacterium]